MTRQTTAPIERLHLENTYRSARELTRMVADGQLTVDLPYQRGSVWTLDQRIELIRSWLTGTPIPSIIINDRWNSDWYRESGGVSKNQPGYAVIDGKQRIETAIMWFSGNLAVPASWFDSSEICATENTEDGPYVRYTGLSKAVQISTALTKFLFPFASAKVATVEDEATIYLRVNGGGTLQTAEDMDRAARVAR